MLHKDKVCINISRRIKNMKDKKEIVFLVQQKNENSLTLNFHLSMLNFVFSKLIINRILPSSKKYVSSVLYSLLLLL